MCAQFGRSEQSHSVGRAGLHKHNGHPEQMGALTIACHCDDCQSFPLSHRI